MHSRAGRDDVEENGEEVGDAAGEDKDMPGGMKVFEPVEGEKDDTEGVGESAGAHPGDAVPADGVDEGTNGKDGEPSLEEVYEGRGHFKTADGEAFEDDAGDGQGPLDAEDGPAERAVQRDEGEGRVGAGDEEIDGGMVEDLKDVAGAGADEGVIERGAEINQDQGGGEDGAGDDVPGGAARGGNDEHGGSGDGEAGADAVGDGVGEDVAQFEFADFCLWLHGIMIDRGVCRLRRGLTAPGFEFVVSQPFERKRRMDGARGHPRWVQFPLAGRTGV